VEAPDPERVAKPCQFTNGAFANGGNFISHGNTVSGSELAKCFVDLDNNAFVDTTFLNSVVRYHNGPTNLRNVHFINCRFILDPPPSNEPSPAQIKVLDTLLDALGKSEVTLG
jgi:hypothetical protein